jgi:hypothetical protein
VDGDGYFTHVVFRNRVLPAAPKDGTRFDS